MVVTLIDVSEGENKYCLVFKAYSGMNDRNKKYKIKFCGSEIDPYFTINDDDKEKLRLLLIEDFGYGPYNMNEMKEKMKEPHSYRLSY